MNYVVIPYDTGKLHTSFPTFRAYDICDSVFRVRVSNYPPFSPMDALHSIYGSSGDSSSEGEKPNNVGSTRGINLSSCEVADVESQEQKSERKRKAAMEVLCKTRYVSKRERKEAESGVEKHAYIGQETVQGEGVPSPQENDESDIFEIPQSFSESLQKGTNSNSNNYNLPKRLLWRGIGHIKGVNCVQWAPEGGPLLASAGMDNVALIWNPFTSKNPSKKNPKYNNNVNNDNKNVPVRRISSHTGAVLDLSFSLDSRKILTGSFDSTAKITDIETGSVVNYWKLNSPVTCVRFQQENVGGMERYVVVGESRGGKISAWDTRCSQEVAWKLPLSRGRVLDIEGSRDGRRFLSSLDPERERGRGAMDETLEVWDVRMERKISHQIYQEGYTCPSVRYHPFLDSFIAQSQGGYIPLFNGNPPFKMNKKLRYEGHEVAGFRVQCGFSSDGEKVISGSADGKFFVFSRKTGVVMSIVKAHKTICTDARWHPNLPSTVASSSWDATVAVWE